MGDVTYTVKAEVAQAFDAFQRLWDVQKKSNDASQQGARHSKDHELSIQSMGRSATHELQGMVTGWLSVGAVIGAAKAGLDLVLEDMKRIDEKNKAATLTLGQAIGKAGDQTVQDFVSYKISKELGGTGVGVEEGTNIYGQVRGVMPGAKIGDVMAIVSQAAKGKQAGYDPAALGETMAQVIKATPGKYEGDQLNLAAVLAGAEGKYGTKIERSGWKAVQQWQAMGLGNAEEALGYLLADVQGEQKGKAFGSMMGKLTEQKPTNLRIGGKQSEKDLLASKFFDTSDSQARLKMLMEDPDLRKAVMGTEAPAVEAMLGQKPAGITKGLYASEKGNVIGERSAEMLKDNRWAEEMAQAEELAKAGRLEYEKGTPQSGARFQQAHLRATGVNPVLRPAGQLEAEIDALRGANNPDLEDATRAIRERNQIELDTAKRVNEAADNLNRATSRPANPNAHTEPNRGGN